MNAGGFGGFGAPGAPGAGVPPPQFGAFGATQPVSSPPAFGGGFGGGAAAFGGGAAFGTPASTAPAPAFGFSAAPATAQTLFGASAQPGTSPGTGFGVGVAGFGAPAPPSSTSLRHDAPSFAFGAGGASSTPAPMFGAAAAAPTFGGGFSAPAPAPAFGGAAAAPAFGAASFSTAPTFGAASTGFGSGIKVVGGGSFGAPAASAPPTFGAAAAPPAAHLDAEKAAALANMPSFVGGGSGGFGVPAPAAGRGRDRGRPPSGDDADDAAAKARRAARFGATASAPAPTPIFAAAVATPLPPFTTPDDDADPTLRGAIVGTCDAMCPAAEVERRERIEDVAVFERPDPSVARTSPALAVKKFARNIEQDPANFRTRAALAAAQAHLRGIMDADASSAPLSLVHRFLWDRYRGVRQDLFVQGMADGFAATLCEEHVRFMVLAEHELCELTPRAGEAETFDSHLNLEQINKALITLGDMYDAAALAGAPLGGEAEFRGYHVLTLAGTHGRYRFSAAVLQDALAHLRPETLASAPVQRALGFARALAAGDWAGFFARLAAAPYLDACLAHMYVRHVRARALTALCAACGGQAVPAEDVARMLGADDGDDARGLFAAAGLEPGPPADNGAPTLVLPRGHAVDADALPKRRFASVSAKGARARSLDATGAGGGGGAPPGAPRAPVLEVVAPVVPAPPPAWAPPSQAASQAAAAAAAADAAAREAAARAAAGAEARAAAAAATAAAEARQEAQREAERAAADAAARAALEAERRAREQERARLDAARAAAAAEVARADAARAAAEAAERARAEAEAARRREASAAAAAAVAAAERAAAARAAKRAAALDALETRRRHRIARAVAARWRAAAAASAAARAAAESRAAALATTRVGPLVRPPPPPKRPQGALVVASTVPPRREAGPLPPAALPGALARLLGPGLAATAPPSTDLWFKLVLLAPPPATPAGRATRRALPAAGRGGALLFRAAAPLPAPGGRLLRAACRDAWEDARAGPAATAAAVAGATAWCAVVGGGAGPADAGPRLRALLAAHPPTAPPLPLLLLCGDDAPPGDVSAWAEAELRAGGGARAVSALLAAPLGADPGVAVAAGLKWLADGAPPNSDVVAAPLGSCARRRVAAAFAAAASDWRTGPLPLVDAARAALTTLADDVDAAAACDAAAWSWPPTDCASGGAVAGPPPGWADAGAQAAVRRALDAAAPPPFPAAALAGGDAAAAAAAVAAYASRASGEDVPASDNWQAVLQECVYARLATLDACGLTAVVSSRAAASADAPPPPPALPAPEPMALSPRPPSASWRGWAGAPPPGAAAAATRKRPRSAALAALAAAPARQRPGVAAAALGAVARALADARSAGAAFGAWLDRAAAAGLAPARADDPLGVRGMECGEGGGEMGVAAFAAEGAASAALTAALERVAGAG